MKVLLMFFLFFLPLLALNYNFEHSGQKELEKIQREIRTQKDYNDFEKDIKMAFEKTKNPIYAFILGLFYSKEHTLKNGKTIKPNFLKAKHNFYIASSHLSIAAYYYSLIEQEKEKALDVIYKRLKKEKNQKNKVLLAIRYAEIVLNNFYNNKQAVKYAIETISPIAFTNENPLLDFVFANLLFINKQKRLANKFLNSACNSPSAPMELKNMCFNNPYIKVDNSEKNGNFNNDAKNSNCK